MDMEPRETSPKTVLIHERSGSLLFEESDASPPKPPADPKSAGDKFWSWNSFAKKAKAVLLDDGISSEMPAEDEIKSAASHEPRSLQKGEQVEIAKSEKEPPAVLQKGLEVVASSLSLIGHTVGLAIEGGLNIVESRGTGILSGDMTSTALKNSLSPGKKSPSANLQKEKIQPGFNNALQLKASRDVAMAMASRAKMLLRELKTVKGGLTFVGNRCSQLEEENKRLRESMVKGVRPEEDDLVRLQLETLLKEKSRLQQENAQYARENQFLHEVVEYHQVALNRLSSEPGEHEMKGQDGEFFDSQPALYACETEHPLSTKTNSSPCELSSLC
ncbi:unnamed protein product [Sphagnum troendelagicum]|uniref:Uncharacterized protein n=1 Tax=Sphagnum troendelagicum TaxID=128251 RepID=A0ABP0TXT6_9BRYO